MKQSEFYLQLLKKLYSTLVYGQQLVYRLQGERMTFSVRSVVIMSTLMCARGLRASY